MHRPAIGPVHASMPLEDVPTFRFVRRMDLAIGGLAILAAVSVWVAAFQMADPPDPDEVLKLSCVVLLVPSLVGIWLMQQAADAPRLAVTGIYASVFRRLAQGERLAVPVPDDAAGFRGVAGVIADLSMLVERLHARWERAGLMMADSNHALAESRDRAVGLAADIARDTTALGDTVAEAGATTTRLSSEIEAATSSFELAEDAVGRTVESLTNLACAVRTTTASAEQMTTMAVRMSQVAHETQASVVGLDERTARLALSLDQVARALVTVSAASQAAEGDAEEAGLARETYPVILSCQAALDEATAVLKGLMSDTSEANRRVAEMSELVHSNHELGYAVGLAVQQQGQDITDILQQIYEARSGFTAIRAGVDAISRAGSASATAMTSLHETARHLPSQADTLATVLRSIPDFAPPDY